MGADASTEVSSATAQDSRDTSKNGVKGSDRRRTYLEVILNTQRDSESEQQNDVDMTGAGAGASGAAAAASGGASAGTVTVVWRGSTRL